MKSLYAKMVLVYTLIILCGFLIFGYTLSNLVRNNYIAQKNKQLVEEAEKISSGFALWYLTGIVDRERFRFEFNFLEDYLNASIIMINRNANIVLQSDRFVMLKQSFIEKLRDDIFAGRISSKRTFVENPQIDNVKKTSEYLVIGYPVIVNQNIIAGIILVTSIDQLVRTVNIFNRIIWVVTLFEVLLVLLITYLFTQQIITPVKKLATTARKVAEGDFNNKLNIKVNTDDEIGELVSSFNYMTEKLKNLEMMRRSFIANVSHELRSPLTSIRGFLEGILDGTIPYDKREYYLTIIKEETIKLNNLINQLLELSKLEWEKITLNISSFKIYSLIVEELIKFEKRIDEKNLNVEVEIDENIIVEGDRELIGRVMHNLIDNAIKYNKDRGKIKIYAKIVEGQAYITVEDTGIGISEETQKLIWERFYKADESRSLENGVGLGLSIVKEIIKLHKQNIWVESKEGFGSKFTFTLNTK